jgi:hypothetical protein
MPAAALAATLAVAPSALATTPDTFTGGGGTSNWNTPANWSAGVPSASSDVAIAAGKTVALSSGSDGAAASISTGAGSTLSVGGGKQLTVGTGASTLDGAVNVSGGSTLTLGGATTWNSGAIDLGTDGTLAIGWTLALESNLTATGGASAKLHVLGAGQVVCDACYGLGPHTFALFDVPVVDDGLVALHGAAAESGLTLKKGGSGTGDFTAEATTTLEFGGSSAFSLGTGASITGQGTTKISGGPLVVGAGATYGATPIDLAGGHLTINSTVNAGPTYLTGSGGTRDGSGTLVLTSAQLDGVTLGGGVTKVGGADIHTPGLTIAAGATLEVTGFVQWITGNVNVAGTIKIDNNGYYEIIPSGGATTTGSGTVQVLAGGTLDDEQSGTTTFTVPVQNAGTIDVTSGVLHVASLTQTAGETYVPHTGLQGPVTLAGGVLDGLGTVTGDVHNSGATLAPGLNASDGPPFVGHLHIAGNYTQDAGGSIAEDVGGRIDGQYDALDVTGNAALAGTLAINTWNTFAPAADDTFTVVSAGGTRTGKFTSLTGVKTGALTYVDKYDAQHAILAFGTPQPDPTPTPTPTPDPTPTPTPTPSPTPQPSPVPSTPQTVPVTAASVIVWPSTHTCASRRDFRIRLVQPKGVALVSATVLVNGKRVQVLKGKRLTAPVDLRGLPKGRFTVKIVAVTSAGQKLSSSRRYRTCAPKRH